MKKQLIKWKPNDLNELLEEYVRRLSGISKVDINNILKKKWDDLEFDHAKNLKNLGWTKATFDKKKYPYSYNLKWNKLNNTEKQSAFKLGYTCSIWNKEKNPNIKIEKTKKVKKKVMMK